jgi:hypothetical protein
MKRMTIGSITAALAVCALAVCAVATATAQAAEPALFECHLLKENTKTKAFEGKYVKGCKVEATEKQITEKLNKYEIEEGAGKGKVFKGKSKGANLEVKGVGGVSCTSSTDTGKFTGPKAASDIVVVFKGCELAHHKCDNTAIAGEIKTNPLKAEIGYVEGGKAAHEVGAALSAEAGTFEAEFTCAELTLRVSGAVVGLVTSPKNAFTKEAKLLFEQSAGVQRIKKLEGGAELHLATEVKTSAGGEFGAAAESGESVESTSKGEELELKA